MFVLGLKRIVYYADNFSSPKFSHIFLYRNRDKQLLFKKISSTTSSKYIKGFTHICLLFLFV